MGKTLVVTEYISSGQSIRRLIEILRKCGVDFDIAAVSVEESPVGDAYSPLLREEFRKRLYYGAIGREGLGFYGSKAAGVTSRSGKISPHPTRREAADSVVKRTGREDMNLLADECSKLL